MAELIDSEEVARRLGVKLSTVYAYVSRGTISSRPDPSSRRSLFDAREIDQLASRGRLVDDSDRVVTGAAVTSLRAHRPIYRGRDLTELTKNQTFEEVAELLMDRPLGADDPFDLPPIPDISPLQRLKWAVLMSEVSATLLSDIRRCVVATTAGRLLATMVKALENGTAVVAPSLRLDDGRVIENSLAGRLASLLAGDQADEVLTKAVNAALVVLADPEFSTEALAVRVAASGHSNVYEAVLVGLSTLCDREPGASNELSYALLLDVERLGVDLAVDDSIRHYGVLSGFGHSDPSVDVRFDAMKPFVGKLINSERVALFQSVLDFADIHHLPAPRVELAIGGMTFAANMPCYAGDVIRAIACTAGWIAHYQDEIEEPILQFQKDAPDELGRGRKRNQANAPRSLLAREMSEEPFLRSRSRTPA